LEKEEKEEEEEKGTALVKEREWKGGTLEPSTTWLSFPTLCSMNKY
jgi:hypothetical protein